MRGLNPVSIKGFLRSAALFLGVAGGLSWTATASEPSFPEEKIPDKSGPPVAFEWSVIPSVIAVKEPVPVTIRAVDADGFTARSFEGRVKFLTGLRSLFGGNPAPRILFTEINTTLQDWVECANVTEEPIDISGWEFTAYDWYSWPNPAVTFLIPEGSICGPGEVFLIYDEGIGPGAYPVFNVGTNIAWNNDTVGNELAVLLRDKEGRISDFVCGFGADFSRIEKPVPIPDSEWNGRAFIGSSNPAVTFHRFGQSDRNDHYDWDARPPSPGRITDWMQLPFVGLPVPVEMSPATSGPFTEGVWSGGIVILSPGRYLGTRARSLDGEIEGLSNLFDVVRYAGFYPRILNYLLGKTSLDVRERTRLDVNGDGALDVADLLALTAAGITAGVPADPSDVSLAFFPPAPLPDLMVASVSWKEGGYSDTETARISFEVRNAGLEPSPECLYEVRLGNKILLEETLPGLAPGDAWSRNDFSLGPLPVGNHSVTVRVDARNEIEEVKKGNNTLTGILPVRIGPRTLQAGSVRAFFPAETVRVPILTNRADAVAGINLRIATDPAYFRVSSVSTPAASLPGFILHWHSPADGVVHVVALPATPDAPDASPTVLCEMVLELTGPAPPPSTVRLTHGAAADRFGSASPSVTLEDGRIEFQAAANAWREY